MSSPVDGSVNRGAAGAVVSGGGLSGGRLSGGGSSDGGSSDGGLGSAQDCPSGTHLLAQQVQPSEQGQGRLPSVSSLVQPAAVIVRAAHSASHGLGRRWFRVMSREERRSA
ncbi:hypothetical protein Q664_08195 [Archangium violaceum Cb vi76]|uniref:Uncharacterized protein n=1 Tax=Archangium violaceum Cb vi76 TaxID=1406225 RepID=A0A084SYN3_9BACT|nr:hypothetical protein Q664_08195 [Archangium violaceum Cb vi76]